MQSPILDVTTKTFKKKKRNIGNHTTGQIAGCSFSVVINGFESINPHSAENNGVERNKRSITQYQKKGVNQSNKFPNIK